MKEGWYWSPYIRKGLIATLSGPLVIKLVEQSIGRNNIKYEEEEWDITSIYLPITTDNKDSIMTDTIYNTDPVLIYNRYNVDTIIVDTSYSTDPVTVDNSYNTAPVMTNTYIITVDNIDNTFLVNQTPFKTVYIKLNSHKDLNPKNSSK